MTSKIRALVLISLGALAIGGKSVAQSDAHPRKCGKECGKCLEAIDKGLAYLVAAQKSGGEWAHHVPHQAFISSTALVGLSILAGGSTTKEGKYKDALGKAVKCLTGKIKENGAVNQRGPWKDQEKKGMETWGVVHTTMFLWEVYKKDPSDFLLEKLKALSLRLLELQRDTGGWTHDFTSYAAGHNYSDMVALTNLAVIALVALEKVGINIKKDVFEKVNTYYEKACNEDGGFRYCLEFPDKNYDPKTTWLLSERGRTAGAVFALTLLGKKDSDMVKKAIKYVSADLRNVAVSPLHTNERFEMSYICGALAYLKLTKWAEFQEAVFADILQCQEKSGAFKFDRRTYSNHLLQTSAALITLQMNRGNLVMGQLPD
jgi:prenyltransferase beta subunit